MNILNTLKRIYGGAVYEHLIKPSPGGRVVSSMHLPEWGTEDYIEALANEIIPWIPGAETIFDATIKPDLMEELGIATEKDLAAAKEILNRLSQKLTDMVTEANKMDRGDDDYLEERKGLAVAASTASQEQTRQRRKLEKIRASKQAKFNAAQDAIQSLETDLQNKSQQLEQAADRAAEFEQHKYKEWWDHQN